jgi:IS30 family transposase
MARCMQAWHTPEGYDVGCLNQRRKLKGMCHYKHLKPTGEGLHSRAVWHKGRPIAYIAAEIGKDSSSVCHKLKRNVRHGRFRACAAQKEIG